MVNQFTLVDLLWAHATLGCILAVLNATVFKTNRIRNQMKKMDSKIFKINCYIGHCV